MDHNKARALDTKFCGVCNTEFSKRKYDAHILTDRHMDRQYEQEQKNKPLNYSSEQNINLAKERYNSNYTLRPKITAESNIDYYWNNNWSDPVAPTTRIIEPALDEVTRRFNFAKFQTISQDLPVMLMCNNYNWYVRFCIVMVVNWKFRCVSFIPNVSSFGIKIEMASELHVEWEAKCKLLVDFIIPSGDRCCSYGESRGLVGERN